MQSSHPKVFFGGDAAWGPENIIWAVAHGHQAAISIDNFCSNVDLKILLKTFLVVINRKGAH